MEEKQPIFKSVFAESWDSMPPVMHKHYANTPYSDDVYVAEGTMNITFGWLGKLLSPIFKRLGVLVPYQGVYVATTVYFRSEKDSNNFIFDRVFNFPNQEPYNFYSTMTQVKGDEVIEYMKFGIGWKCSYIYEEGKVKLLHRGYVWEIFGLNIPVPISLLMGKGYAEEESVDEDSFNMIMTIKHPIWGKVYEYKGTFTMKEKTNG